MNDKIKDKIKKVQSSIWYKVFLVSILLYASYSHFLQGVSSWVFFEHFFIFSYFFGEPLSDFFVDGFVGLFFSFLYSGYVFVVAAWEWLKIAKNYFNKKQ